MQGGMAVQGGSKMRCAGTALLLLASCLALPLSANAVPIWFEGLPPGHELSSRGGSQANIDLSGLPSATNGPTNHGTQHAAGLAPVFNSVVVVPEPGALPLLVLGLGLLLVARKSKAITHHN